MAVDGYSFRVAVSQLSGEGDTRDEQATRAVLWLLGQPGASVVVVTPTKRFDSEVLDALIACPETTHLTWRGLSMSNLDGKRVVYAWPDKKHLRDLRGVRSEALVVIEWGKGEASEWMEDAKPVRLKRDGVIEPVSAEPVHELAPLPNGVDQILKSLAASAKAYSSGLKWNEEDKLKADLMNNSDRWAPITVDQIRAKCRELDMRPNDVEKIATIVTRWKQGHRFNVRALYRDWRFEPSDPH